MRHLDSYNRTKENMLENPNMFTAGLLMGKADKAFQEYENELKVLQKNHDIELYEANESNSLLDWLKELKDKQYILSFNIKYDFVYGIIIINVSRNRNGGYQFPYPSKERLYHFIGMPCYMDTFDTTQSADTNETRISIKFKISEEK